MGTHREVFVPDIGDFKNVDVIEVLVKPGDAVQPEQSLIAVESDKATMEIPSPAAGVVKEMRVKTGDKVSQGSPILILEETENASAAPTKPAPKPQDAPSAKAAPVLAAVPAPTPAAPALGRTEAISNTSAPAPGTTPHASPSVRKFARELGVDRARGVPQGERPGSGKRRLQTHHARVPGEGFGERAEGVSGVQRLARQERGEPDRQEVLSHRSRGRYARRPTGASDPRR